MEVTLSKDCTATVLCSTEEVIRSMKMKLGGLEVINPQSFNENEQRILSASIVNFIDASKDNMESADPEVMTQLMMWMLSSMQTKKGG